MQPHETSPSHFQHLHEQAIQQIRGLDASNLLALESINYLNINVQDLHIGYYLAIPFMSLGREVEPIIEKWNSRTSQTLCISGRREIHQPKKISSAVVDIIPTLRFGQLYSPYILVNSEVCIPASDIWQADKLLTDRLLDLFLKTG